MKKTFIIIISSLMFTLLFLGSAYACGVSGKVYCDVNNNGIIDKDDTPLANLTVSVTGEGWWFDRPVVTDPNGFYYIPLEFWGCNFTLTVGPDGLPADAIFITPNTNPYNFSTCNGNWDPVIDILIQSKGCQSKAGLCWMTAGGVKFDQVVNSYVAEYVANGKKPWFNFGGNTAPSCSLLPGEGGQWNFVDRAVNIHFQAWTVEGVECYNISGIDPGTKSPVAPFNTIEFWGTGTVKPASGKKVAGVPVKYWAHFQDRNEPGNLSAGPNSNEGAKVDRLYIRVYTDGGTVYLIDADPATPAVDPVLITGGNIQIHPCK